MTCICKTNMENSIGIKFIVLCIYTYIYIYIYIYKHIFQIQDNVVYISHSANNRGKNMNPTILSPPMS